MSTRRSLARFIVVSVVVASLAVPAALVGVAVVVADRNAVEQQVSRGQQLATTAATLIAVARETGSAADRAMIAAVFTNRLRIGSKVTASVDENAVVLALL